MRASDRRRPVLGSLLAAAAALAGLLATTSAGADGPDRVLYLTFDDGPALDSATASLLDLLASEGVTATFFVVGDNVDRNPAMIRRIIDSGHALGSHSDTHRPLNEMTDDQVRTEFVATQAAVSRAGGPTMSCYRPPFGATSDTVRAIGASLGMSEELWDRDVRDYDRVDAQLYADALAQAQDGEVVLLHDGFTDGEMTVEAVRRFLRGEGANIEFRPLPGCGSDTPPPPTQTTTSTTTPSTSTSATTSTPKTTTTAAPVVTTAAPLVISSEVVIPEAPCRRGPLGDMVDTSDERHGAVFRIYCSHLGRQPDAAGFRYWLGVASETSSLAPLSHSFLLSKEFVETYGELDDEHFVLTVYANVLGRTPDVLGRDYWLGLLADEVDRSDVMQAFSEAAEFRTSTHTA